MRQGILDRAARLFARKGYQRSTVDEIARACRLSRGALYHYFSSKEAILNQILAVHLAARLATVSEAAIARNDPEDRLRAIVRAMVQANARSRAEQIVLLHDSQYLGRRERAAIVQRQNEIVQVIDDAVAALASHGRIAPRHRKVRTMILLGMINYTYLWYDAAGPVGPESYAQMVSDIFLGQAAAPAGLEAE